MFPFLQMGIFLLESGALDLKGPNSATQSARTTDLNVFGHFFHLKKVYKPYLWMSFIINQYGKYMKQKGTLKVLYV